MLPASLQDEQLRADFYFRLLSANNIEDVNSGGCLAVAYAAVRYLLSKGVKAEIIYKVSYNRQIVLDYIRKQKPSSCNHALIHIDGYFYDSGGRYDVENLDGYTLCPISLSYAVFSLNLQNGWNYFFDRTRIQDILDIFEVTDFYYCKTHNKILPKRRKTQWLNWSILQNIRSLKW